MPKTCGNDIEQTRNSVSSEPRSRTSTISLCSFVICFFLYYHLRVDYLSKLVNFREYPRCLCTFLSFSPLFSDVFLLFSCHCCTAPWMSLFSSDTR